MDQIFTKELFPSKVGQMNITIEFGIIELVQLLKFILMNSFDFSNQIRPKMVFLIQNRICEHHHSMRHIRINLDDEFCLHQTIFILILWIRQICPKRVEKFNSLEIIFKNNKKVAMTRFNISVVVKAAEIKGIYFDIL